MPAADDARVDACGVRMELQTTARVVAEDHVSRPGPVCSPGGVASLGARLTLGCEAAGLIESGVELPLERSVRLREDAVSRLWLGSG